MTINVMQVDHYERFSFEPRHVNIRPLHVCDSSKESLISCINERGKSFKPIIICAMNIVFHVDIEIKIKIVYCDCELLAITLAYAQLWPASPLSTVCIQL